jgi:hypothetical protein
MKENEENLEEIKSFSPSAVEGILLRPPSLSEFCLSFLLGLTQYVFKTKMRVVVNVLTSALFTFLSP